MSIWAGEKIRLIEMGARDGLQSEKAIIPLETKIELINRLSQTGIRHIEAGSFVSPKWRIRQQFLLVLSGVPESLIRH